MNGAMLRLKSFRSRQQDDANSRREEQEAHERKGNGKRPALPANVALFRIVGVVPDVDLVADRVCGRVAAGARLTTERSARLGHELEHRETVYGRGSPADLLLDEEVHDSAARAASRPFPAALAPGLEGGNGGDHGADRGSAGSQPGGGRHDSRCARMVAPA